MASRSCFPVGSSNQCQSPLPAITLHHIGIHLFPTHFHSREQQSPASPLSSLSSSPHRGPGPHSHRAMREAQSQTQPGRTQRAVCLPYPSVSAFTWSQNRWMHSQFSSEILGSVASSYKGRKIREEEGKRGLSASEHPGQEAAQTSLVPLLQGFLQQKGEIQDEQETAVTKICLKI